ncbi:mucin-5AC isoform X2 [Phthorimaea operculella]|nr:mucin-5AC isoform X2 [Phthorimaea operculella]
MYKTVRHGENSLQYTILPQTEEVLNNSGLKGKGRDYSPSIHVRRSRRKSTVKYVLLVLFGVVLALALAAVPLYVMNGALYARRNHQDSEIITNSPHTPSGREIVKSRKKELKMFSVVLTTGEPKLETTSTTVSSTTSSTTTTPPPTVTSERATTPPWMPAIRLWKSAASSTTIRPIPTEDTEKIPLVGTPISLLDYHKSGKPWEDIIIKPTTTPEPITVKNVFKYLSKTNMPSARPISAENQKFEDVLITTRATTVKSAVTTEVTTDSFKDLKDTLLSVDDDDEFKESLEVDEVFSLPPLKPESPVESDDVIVSKAGGAGWYGSQWPFVDTSSYFQWTGYSPGDNLLLPLLVAALCSIALVLLLALAVRRRKRSHVVSQQIGLTADLQADDNTNLLTAENPEDGDE